MKTANDLYKEFSERTTHYVQCEDQESLYDVCLNFCTENVNSPFMSFEVTESQEDDLELWMVFNYETYASSFYVGLHDFKIDHLHDIGKIEYELMRNLWA